MKIKQMVSIIIIMLIITTTANLPVAKQWNPNQQGAPQQGSQPGPDQQQGGNSDKPYNAPVVQHTDL